MARKRIAIFGWSSSVHVQRWTSGMLARDFDIKVVSLGGDPLPDAESVIIERRGRLSYLTQAGRAAKEALKFKPDLVHAHYAVGFGYWAMRTAFRPSLLSVWGADVIDFPSNPFKRFLIRKVLRSADHLTATSQLLKDTVVKLLPGSDSKVTVIPFGVNIPDTVATFPDSPPVRLCFIKVHYKKYGPDILLKAMAAVVKEIPDIKLSIAGYGEMTEILKQMTRDLQLENNVEFVGFIDNREIYPFIQKHHIMVMPSVLDSESFGVAVIEAGACRRPVIASRVGGVPEVMRDGETGLLLPPGDVDALAAAIIRLATDRELAVTMGERGFESAKENYDWEKSLDMMAETYHRLIHEKK
jgi:glycosyltransferase involved in cell wall biosynthesis